MYHKGYKVLYKSEHNTYCKGIIKSYDDEQKILVINSSFNSEELKISEAQIIEISKPEEISMRDRIVTKFSKFCFRRVYKITTCELIGRKKIMVNNVGQIHYEKTDESGDNVSEKYIRYYGFTSNISLRDEGEIFPTEILYFSSITECDLDEYGNLVPLPYYRRGYPPKRNQLICGIVGEKTNSPNPPYKAWFKCSEQFYKTITTIRNPNHPSNLHLKRKEILDKISTNILRLYIEESTKYFKESFDFNQIDYEKLLLNEHTETYSNISFFYQFLIKDCIYLDTQLDWNQIRKSVYFKNHRYLYLLFKRNMLWMNNHLDLEDEEYQEFPVCMP